MTDTVLYWLGQFEKSNVDLETEIKRINNLINQEERSIESGKLDELQGEVVIKTLEEYLECLKKMQSTEGANDY